MWRVFSFFVFVALIGGVLGNFPAPENVTSTLGSTSVILRWSGVVGAAGYKVVLVNSTSNDQVLQSAETQDSAVAFSGLLPSSTYKVTIRATDLNTTDGNPTTYTFTTLLGEIEGVSISDATSTTIEITWTPLKGAVRYEVRMTLDDDIPFTPGSLTPFENTMFVTGLRAMTFYKIYVRGVTSDGEVSEETELRTRTDGSGIQVDAWWEGPDGALRGGATIFRPLQIPVGLYRMRVFFPCPVVNYTFWNVYVNETASQPEKGFFLVFQNITWMWLKTEVGVVFDYGINATSCSTLNETITVDFGDDIAPNPEDTCTNVPFVREEWSRVPINRVEYAGWIKIQLGEVYGGTNVNDELTNTTVQKPEAGSFFLALDTGAGCPGGLIIHPPWGMTRKDTTFLAGSRKNLHHFIQKQADWTQQLPGFLYGFDPKDCGSRDNITVSVCVDSSFVTSVFSSSDYGEIDYNY